MRSKMFKVVVLLSVICATVLAQTDPPQFREAYKRVARQAEMMASMGDAAKNMAQVPMDAAKQMIANIPNPADFFQAGMAMGTQAMPGGRRRREAQNMTPPPPPPPPPSPPQFAPA